MILSKKFFTQRAGLFPALLLAGLLLAGCESLPFRLGSSIDSGKATPAPTQNVPAVKPVYLTTADSKGAGTTSSSGSSSSSGSAAGSSTTTAAKTPPAPEVVTKKISYKVAAGDTIYSLARQNNMTPATLAKDNNLKITDKLKVGQTVIINKKVVITSGTTSQATTDKTGDKTATDKGGDSGGGFIWPLPKIALLQGFGQGTSPDGMIIAGNVGQGVRAINDGVVIYVGDDIKTLGLLVLVKHDDNVVSTYGYLQKSMVTKGSAVKRGQVIANLGQSGSANRPELYFEIRKNNHPANPTDYLPAAPK